MPYPLDKGDKVRAYHQIEALSRYHEVCLFSLTDQEIHPQAEQALQKICSRLVIVRLSKLELLSNLFRTFLSAKPMQVGYFYNARSQGLLNNLIDSFKPDALFCQLIRTAEYVRSLPLPKTLDYMDVFSKGIQRRIRKVPFYQRPFFNLEYKRLLKYEEDIFSCFDRCTIISVQDRDLIPHPNRASIAVIPNGVDMDFFHPPDPSATSVVKDYDVLFNGNMSYPPNIESAVFLVEQIMPFVWKKYPEVKVLISGTTPSMKVKRLGSRRVQISGWVEDVRTNFARSLMLVAPMQSSIGLQNKLIEAMAMKLPCVTSTLANNALGAEDGTQVLVADSPEQYAARIFSLFENKIFAAQLAENGYAYVRKQYDWEQAGQKLNEVILQGAESHKAAG
ncbi:MAG TPA: glycosyltransferase [Bacteroidia bacterium]|nr:glycosyltransferase [Bacteroidia bacterium]